MRSDSDDRDDDDSANDDAGDGDGEGKDDNDISDDTGSVRIDDNGDIDDADDDRDDDEDGTADGSRTMMVDTNVNGNDGLADAIPTSAVSADDRDIVDDIVTTNAEWDEDEADEVVWVTRGG